MLKDSQGYQIKTKDSRQTNSISFTMDVFRRTMLFTTLLILTFSIFNFHFYKTRAKYINNSYDCTQKKICPKVKDGKAVETDVLAGR